MKGATKDARQLVAAVDVSIHAPVKGATRSGPSYARPRICFNPRTREGCDVKALQSPIAAFVSIHAPVKGATLYHRNMIRSCYVSIHAPVKGATPDRRTPLDHRHVSIHAPVKGATAKGLFTVSFACIDGDMAPLIHFLLTTLGI